MNNIVVGIGVVLLVVGLISQFYTFTTVDKQEGFLGIGDSTDVNVNAPYQQFAIPLIVLGVIVIIAGALLKRS